MIDTLLQIVAPHHCYGCAQIGSVLCDNCKYDIVDEFVSTCIVCALPSVNGICESCRSSYDRAWFVGDRAGPLMALIDGLKFSHVKAAAKAIAELLDNLLPMLPPDTVIVPVPTVSSHIRQRGYDQTLLIARALAKHRKLKVNTSLTRSTRAVQRGQTKKTRHEQARTAFRATNALADVPYLLLDDVVTTNATVRFAAEELRRAGAKTVWVAVGARQPLEKS